MIRFAAPVLLLLALPSVASAQGGIPGAADMARIKAGTYAIDPNHSQVLWTVNHLGFSEYTGQFVHPTGTLMIDPANTGAAKVEVAFPIADVITTVAGLNTHLKTADFFDATKFPEGRFVSTKVIVKGQTATITGNLTLKGVTKPVMLQARFVGAGPNPRGGKLNFGFAATTTIKRSDFGITFGVPAISDEVRLVINAAFEAQ